MVCTAFPTVSMLELYVWNATYIYIYIYISFLKKNLIRLVYVIYTVIGDVCLYVGGKDEYDEVACKYILAYL